MYIASCLLLVYKLCNLCALYIHFEEGLRPKHCVIKSKKILVITMQSDPLRSDRQTDRQTEIITIQARCIGNIQISVIN